MLHGELKMHINLSREPKSQILKVEEEKLHFIETARIWIIFIEKKKTELSLVLTPAKWWNCLI